MTPSYAGQLAAIAVGPAFICWHAIPSNLPVDSQLPPYSSGRVHQIRRKNNGIYCQFDSPARPLNPWAMTYHSLESLRLAGGLACFTVVKWRFNSATRL